MAKVNLTNLVKEYRDGKRTVFRAVKGIDLEIRDREFMVLVGPSGCGKSTSLRMIAGLEDITAGSISIAERVVNDVLPKNRDIAMVFQNYALYPHMSVYDNMAFGLKLMKYSKAEIDERVRYAAGILGLESLLERKPKQLSGGQRQRVAVGRAIVRKPKVFLFDEPLSNLDAKMRVQMRTEISKLHTRLNTTMIYVTHDQVEAMTMGDRICVMKDGHIMQVAEPLELYNRPANMFVGGFIGSPPMNFFRGAVHQHAGALFFTERNDSENAFTVGLDARFREQVGQGIGGEFVLGLRPEDLRLAGVDEESAIRARVEVSEPMGAETYLHLDTGGHAFVARVGCSQRFQSGEIVGLVPDMGKAHLFDPMTEANLATRNARN
ncbi:sn-glycerol-3-phosphate ABC transporter ATP-binding protein UgpC [Ruficoccus amylovorans]|uniref:sn-glycerol-3-phosphate ABC transporter ATP-binding protein UgpC n=1 Tax=Ruficoccus amylovorans TaxID=1804625 RepID=A0A842HI12_9BACT|nr:sn-glycerol-3-phosphate ABC transporter ATP-binding protein UgpC [Ruficoccus amylovorans]MBC2595177.1 sn-glycerol-3-phosphate ABC transporter ATP-binding protein UgpC [Ruficoccus amylovorans]